VKQLFARSLVVVLVVAAVLWLNTRHPVGESEQAIWKAIVAHERFSSYSSEELEIVSWRRGPNAGDLAPMHDVRISAGDERLRLKCSARCNQDGWKASVHSVLPD
jgi:hypothetical protein